MAKVEENSDPGVNSNNIDHREWCRWSPCERTNFQVFLESFYENGFPPIGDLFWQELFFYYCRMIGDGENDVHSLLPIISKGVGDFEGDHFYKLFRNAEKYDNYPRKMMESILRDQFQKRTQISRADGILFFLEQREGKFPKTRNLFEQIKEELQSKQ